MRVRAYGACARLSALACVGLAAALAILPASPAGAVPPPKDVLLNPRIYTPAEVPAEVARVKAVNEILEDRYANALPYEEKAQDPAVTAIRKWRQTMFADPASAFEQVNAFLAAYPGWPSADKMRARAERSLGRFPQPADKVLGFFKDKPPQTVTGKLALAEAERSRGRPLAAQRIVRGVWTVDALGEELEAEILRKHGKLLRKRDHEARFAKRLYELDLPGALRVAKLLDEGADKVARAVAGLARGTKEGFSLYQKLSDEQKALLPVKYALTRYYRLSDKESQARAVALAANPHAGKWYDAERWWEEKRVLVRHALRQRDRKLAREAYEIASQHGHDGGLPFVEGEFLAGWIALRFLKEPERSVPHFKRLAAGNKRPVNIAQGEYWAGRAYDAMGQPAEAARHYARAGAHSTTFYGQLARDRLGWPRVAETVTTSGQARIDALATLDDNLLFRAARLIAQARRGDFLPLFFNAVMRQVPGPDGKAAVIQWAWSAGYPHVALRLAKAASLDGVALGQLMFPAPVWQHKALTPEPEPALVYGVIRQESEFNPRAQSHAGARGLMQIMPNTAKGLSRNYNADFDLARLLTDSAYNVQLGSALLHELLNTFDGFYVLVLAAYNTGPGHVYRWIKEFGDPRNDEIDLLDWIEMIPFTETRNYVKRVMENVNVYRARFGQERPDRLFVGLQRSQKGDLEQQAACHGRAEGRGEPGTFSACR